MSIKGEFCVFILLVSTFLASSRPHHFSKRSIVKDYLNPLTYPTAAVQFEKGEDGKYHSHLIDSKVEYALAKNLEELNGIAKDAVRPSNSGGTDSEKQEGMANDVVEELGKIATGITSKQDVEDIVKDSAKVLSGFLTDTSIEGFGSEAGTKSVEIENKSGKKAKTRYTLVKQEDHKLQFLPKPDGKDDQPYEVEDTPLEEYLPQPPLAPEVKKKKEEGFGKLIIGQIPFFGSLPFLGSSVFLPDRSLSFSVMSRLPLPPALAVQDRLPMTDDAEVMEEGSETAQVENIDPVSGMVRGERRTTTHRFSNPFGREFTFPLVTMKKSMKELMDGQEPKEKSKAQIVDVMGKKMLLQNKVMKYPTDDSSRMYVGVMSVRLLDEVDLETLKKLGVEKEAKGTDNSHRETEDKLMKEEKGRKEEPILSSGVDKVLINLSEEMDELGFDVGRHSEAEVLKVEESKPDEKREMSDDVVAQATGITSTSEETVTGNETKEDSFQDGDLKADGIGKGALDVEDKVHRINLKVEETNAKKLIDFETKNHQGSADEKELSEADVKKEETLTENKVANESERVSVEEFLDRDSMAALEASIRENIAAEASEVKAEDSKSTQNDLAAKSGEIVVDNDSVGADSTHELDQFDETDDEKENSEFNSFDGSLEDKDLKLEDKIAGLLLAESKNKRFADGSKEIKKQMTKKSRKGKCEDGEVIESDSEDGDG